MAKKKKSESTILKESYAIAVGEMFLQFLNFSAKEDNARLLFVEKVCEGLTPEAKKTFQVIAEDFEGACTPPKKKAKAPAVEPKTVKRKVIVRRKKKK